MHVSGVLFSNRVKDGTQVGPRKVLYPQALLKSFQPGSAAYKSIENGL